MLTEKPVNAPFAKDGAWLCNKGPMCIAAGKLLAKQPELKANFSRAQGASSNAKANKVARFLPNPEANWGPKPKHGRAVKVCCYLTCPQRGKACPALSSHVRLALFVLICLL